MYLNLTMVAFGMTLSVMATAMAAVVREEASSWAGEPLMQPGRACGKDVYSTDEYVCRQNFLCPVVNGEPLSLCGDACYSRYMYTCRPGAGLQMRAPLERGSITLRAETPHHHRSRSDDDDDDDDDVPSPLPPAPLAPPSPDSDTLPPGVDGLPMTACGLAWNIGGATCSYCPVARVPRCPASTATALVAATNAMDVVVPGGQQFFLTADWTVGYTQAHSALVPDGATTAGFRAFVGGGYFNVLDGAWGWAACPAAGTGRRRSLHVRNSTNAPELSRCIGLNLAVESFDDVAAWQYS